MILAACTWNEVATSVAAVVASTAASAVVVIRELGRFRSGIAPTQGGNDGGPERPLQP